MDPAWITLSILAAFVLGLAVPWAWFRHDLAVADDQLDQLEDTVWRLTGEVEEWRGRAESAEMSLELVLDEPDPLTGPFRVIDGGAS